MNTETLLAFFGWCSVINISIFLYWFLFFALGRDRIYRLHTRWFQLPAETFDTIHYRAMAHYKIAILVLNIVPYLALRITQ